ncbi:M4 family metallopeptidase [Nocardioides jiangxiensis]|uniref:Neutral metalloproteinase n=1 Tax=Nocardioides jiangxiensis TaxID=3064524 RepID=A0ABT9AYH5_9ACTN|nr:M4 family metallopeptidase [Nocardioides sp. WY-20]MDO7867627.1 M4 family metallopeptidase [Nocardioides sp. WY-20]
MHRISALSRSSAAVGLATAALASVAFSGTASPARAAAGGDGGPTASARAVVAAALDQLESHPRTALLSDGIGFVAGRVQADADGSRHVRLDRTYQGLPVRGGDLVVHEGPGAAYRGTSQTLAAPLDLPVVPTVPQADAERAAEARDATTARIRGFDARGARLVVDTLGGAPRLAWEVTSVGRYVDGTPSSLRTYVDARTGDVLRREERIETIDGDGESLWSGHVPLQVSQSGSSYVLKDPTRGGTYTVTVANTQDGALCGGLLNLGVGCAREAQLPSTDTSWGDGTTGSAETVAVDAQYGTNATWDYYEQVHGREGIFGNGTGSYNRVHYGKNYVNAFWDGTRMTYGDGNGTTYGPLVSLDVAGHEMSHGVTEHTAGLAYSGEAGGLNEATSDIFGTMVEFHAANPSDPGDYLIGEQFALNGTTPLRRMDDPATDGHSATCWSSTAKSLDVHYSSGIANHFFYVLSEGTGARTINGVAYDAPSCDGTQVAGIGRDEADQIWYRALTTYMTSGTTYAAARTATLDAAADLYGPASVQHGAVAAAWDASGVH